MSESLPSLLQSEPGLLPAMLGTCSALVLILDSHGAVCHANGTAERLAGVEPGGLTGVRLPATPGKSGQPAIPATSLAALLDGHGPLTFTGTWPGPEPHDIEWHMDAVRDADGTVRWVVATGIDTTPTARAIDALEDVEAHLRAVLQTAADGIITTDEQQIVRSFNPAAERIFGHPAEAIIGQPVARLTAATGGGGLPAGLPPGTGPGRETLGLRADGREFPMEVSVSEVRFDDTLHFSYIVRDVSERHQVERERRRRLEELAHAGRLSALGEMSSGIAHELNQPLAAMVAFAQALQRMLDAGKLDRETLRDSLAQIAAQGQRAGAILSRVLRLARKTAVSYEPVDLNAVVRDVLALVGQDSRLQAMRVNVELDSGLPTVQADRVQLEQVLLNLLRNALDAQAEVPAGQAWVTIRTAVTDRGRASVSVEDGGTGLSDDDLERAFDSFYTTKPDGLGLGLSISRSIIESHGGRLLCERCVGGGARFFFHLPAANPA